MTQVVIAGAVRTPIGSLNGSLSSVPAHYLGEVAIVEALKRAKLDPGEGPEATMAQILTHHAGHNPPRPPPLHPLGGSPPARLPAPPQRAMCPRPDHPPWARQQPQINVPRRRTVGKVAAELRLAQHGCTKFWEPPRRRSNRLSQRLSPDRQAPTQGERRRAF